jgi:hypothetical protein
LNYCAIVCTLAQQRTAAARHRACHPSPLPALLHFVL